MKKEMLKIKIQMLLLHLLASFAMASATYPEIFCDQPTDYLTKRCFVREVIATIPHSPNQLAVDRNQNHLYFSFDSGQGEYIPGTIKLQNNTITVLKGVKDAFAMAYDAVTGDIYFGGSHGIYRYYPMRKILKRLNVNYLDIWWLLSRKTLYFIKFPNLDAYMYENKTMSYVKALRNHTVHQFVFDKENNIFFINFIGLFMVENGSSNPILLIKYSKFTGMATDNNGSVYLCSEEGIFVIILNKLTQKMKKVLNIQGVLGLTFDKFNNIIYSNSNEIVRLSLVPREEYYASLRDENQVTTES